MDTTQINPNQNYFSSGATFDTSKPIPVSGLTTTQTPVKLPPQDNLTENPNYYAGVTAGIPTIQDLVAQAQTTSPSETANQTLMQRILGSVQKLGGKQQAQAQAETTAGIPQFQTQLTDINAQLQGLQKEALAIPLQLQQEAQGRGITAGGLAPIQTGQLRQNAIRSLGLSSIAQTLQGNIANAQAQADRAVQMEFAPVEAELKYLQTAYEMNKDILNREDKKKADALNIQLQERTRLLENQKEDKKIIYGWAAEAAKNGAPALLVARAQQSTNPAEALFKLSQYMSDPEAKANALMQRKVQQAQIDKIYSDMALSKEELKLKYAKEATTQVIDPATGKPSTELKINARQSAQTLLDMFTKGAGTFAVGGTRIFGTQYIPGTAPQDFSVQFNNLKSLLSLDNVKLLKGQGQVSDAERALLAAASSNLQLSQSEKSFKENLKKINIGLGNPQTVILTNPKTGESKTVPVDADTLNQAISDGLTVTY